MIKRKSKIARTLGTRDAKKINGIHLHEERNQFANISERDFTMASLFSGIGGFDLGFERAGFKTTSQCEINKFCRAILEKHWPNIPRTTNIKELTNGAIPIADVWTGGFPCQDVSLARMGPRAGLKGARS